MERFTSEFMPTGDDGLAEEFLSPDIVMHFGGQQQHGRDAYLAVVAANRDAFPDLVWTVDDMVADGDTVAVRYTMTGDPPRQLRRRRTDEPARGRAEHGILPPRPREDRRGTRAARQVGSPAADGCRTPAMDGVTLEGWFIPADSDRLIICNHPMSCNRYEYPGHLEPWTNFGGFEVNSFPEYKVLHDAGYNILAMIALQPAAPRGFVEAALDGAGIADGREAFDNALHRRSGYRLDDFRPIEDTKAVTVPTLVAQVHDDFTMPPSYVQAIYDNISAEDKRLFWIEGTDLRFEGYNYFGEHPELLLEWFETHM